MAQDAEGSSAAERTVIGLLPVRVTCGPGLRAAELSWGCRRAALSAGRVCMDGALVAASAGW